MSPRLESLVKRASGALEVTLETRQQRLWGGYGELWRVELRIDSGTVPAIVKYVQPPAGNADRSHRRKLRSYAVEQAFYRDYGARCLEPPSSRVPRALGLLSEAGGWLFVLEDLDAAGFGHRSARPDSQQIEATLRWLASFHARFLGARPENLWPTGTYWHLATRPDELSAMRDRALRSAAPQIDRALERARFKTFVHGDAKLENVCLAPSGAEVALVDFQYVGGGVGVKDVAYFLSSCLAPDECEALVPRYLDQYLSELEHAVSVAGTCPDFSALEREWRALFPLAWVDYYRFLAGWAPGQFDREPYAVKLLPQVIAGLRSA